MSSFLPLKFWTAAQEKASWLTPFQNLVSFYNAWMTGLAFATLSSRMRSAARSGIHYCGGERFLAVQSCCRGFERRKRHSKQSLALWKKKKVWNSQDTFVVFTFTETKPVIISHLALNKDFSQRKCSRDKSPGRRDFFFTKKWSISPWKNWVRFLGPSEVSQLCTLIVQKKC